MKKFITGAILAALVAVSSVVVMAEKPVAGDFEANNGFYYGPNKSEVVQDEDHRSVPTVADAADGVAVAHKGYYQSGANCGGVHSTEKYDLNGLSFTVKFDLVPDVTTDTDTWISLDILEYPRAFYTNNFTEEGNRGIENLIRFGRPYLEVYEGVTGFSQVYNSQGADATVNEAFGIKTGDVVTVSFARNEDNTYKMTYKNGDAEAFEVPYDFKVGDVFADGKGYISVIASCELGDQEGFKYTITDVTNGVEMTEEEKAAIAEKKAADELEAKKAQAAGIIALVEGDAAEMLEKAKETADDTAIAAAQEAVDAVEEIKAKVESGEFEIEDIQKSADEVADLVHDAKDLVKKAGEKAAEVVEEGKEAVEEAANKAPEAVKEAAKGSNTGLIIGIIIAVIAVIAIVAAVLAKKKK